MFKKKSKIKNTQLPKHIAIIMDGNGRWAKKRSLPRTLGHKKGAEVLGTITRHCRDIGIQYLTVYAFSTENWKRPQEEIDQLFCLLKEYLYQTSEYKDENVKLVILGDLDPFDDELKQLIAEIMQTSSKNTGITLNLAFNYGGRDELVKAIQKIATDCVDGNITSDEINGDLVSDYLYTKGQPDPDLIIRPSGEHRLSNFLMWQSVYSEFVFMKVLWPDFTPKHLDEAILQYTTRERRFGGI